jgi:MFS family permease
MSGGGSKAEWKAGWPTAVSGAGGVALSTLAFYSSGAFVAPLEREFGWSRAEIASSIMIANIAGILFTPVVGIAIDRIGPRRIGIVGVVLVCAAIAAMSLAGPSIVSWWVLAMLLGIATLGITPPVWTSAVSSLFVQGRGLALALTLCGTGIGSTLTPFLAATLVSRYGWRTAYVILGAGWAAVLLPLLLAFFYGARDKLRLKPAEAPVSVPAALTGLSVRQGFASSRFWRLAVAGMIITLAAVSFVVNVIPILSSQGIARQTAAELAGIVGIASITGRLSTGFLLDRFSGALVAGTCVILPILSAGLLLAAPGSIPVAILALVLLGLSLGSELDCVAYLATRHLGLRHYGALFGVISSFLALATGAGPFLVGFAYDAAKSYSPVLWAYIPLCVLASLLLFTLGPYPVFPVGEAEPDGGAAAA